MTCKDLQGRCYCTQLCKSNCHGILPTSCMTEDAKLNSPYSYVLRRSRINVAVVVVVEYNILDSCTLQTLLNLVGDPRYQIPDTRIMSRADWIR